MDNYIQLKAAGAISVDSSSTPDNLIISVKQYDPNTGTPLTSTIQQYSYSLVNSQISTLTTQLSNWQAMLADFPTE